VLTLISIHHHNIMPQSFSAVYLHAVFSTKERRPFLRDLPLRTSLHGYLGAISKNLKCAPLRIGGVEDHVHILARLGRIVTQADWIKEMKRASNLWIKEQAQPAPSPEGPSAPLSEFAWQGGYACFSVSASNLDAVTTYIDGQAEHHRKMSFKDELRALLKKHGEAWDEKYVWD
jgi:REP element-mobilizing transposase RayT